MTKTKCLTAFATNRITRGWKPLKVSEFLSSVRAFPFLLQAGQAVNSLTGYGISLGAYMAMVSDSIWGVVRLAQGGSIKVSGPPPSDLLGKAVRYLSQPSYHVKHSALMTYEEHYLLAAADAVAIQTVAAAYSPALAIERAPIFEASRVIEYEPWAPDTRAGLAAVGYRPGGELVEPLEGASAAPTYGEVLRLINEGHAEWWAKVAGEFPKSSAATYFALMVSEGGRAAFDWFNQTPGSIQPVFDPEEIAIARLFELGIRPKAPIEPDLLGEFASRALELAAAGGSDLPAAGEVQTALNETNGGFVQL